MKRVPILATIIVLAAAGVMVALGVWQLKRLDQKEALLARYAAAEGLAEPVAFPITGDGEQDWFRTSTLDYKFKVENNGAVIDAEYTGLVPDTFQDGSEVVISGQLSAHGFTVDPNGVMAKCPSKYEPKPTLGSAASSN